MLWMSSADKQCLRPSQGIAAIRPKIRPIGLAPVRIGLWHRGFIGMQHRAPAQQLGEAPPERFQGDAGTAHFVAIRTQ
jgi:hypothetical protein